VVAAPLWIMIAGPYSTGARNAAERATNLRVLNDAALALFRKGHIPVVGVNAALPVIAAAGGSAAAYDEIMMPMSLALAERCDACLRIGGKSQGADDEVARFAAAGKTVYRRVEDVPERVRG